MLIPPALMTRIVARLARADLLKTFPGREGGLMLPRPAAQITLRDVVEAFEGPILLSECLQAKGEDDCPFRTNCPVSPKWGRVQVAMLREMAAITFEGLAQETLGAPLKIPVERPEGDILSLSKGLSELSLSHEKNLRDGV
jgi:Rrf2 family protein